MMLLISGTGKVGATLQAWQSSGCGENCPSWLQDGAVPAELGAGAVSACPGAPGRHCGSRGWSGELVCMCCLGEEPGDEAAALLKVDTWPFPRAAARQTDVVCLWGGRACFCRVPLC